MAMQQGASAAAAGAATPGAVGAADVGGVLGMTPSPSPGGGVPPSGVSPTAKRPRNPENVAMDGTGPIMTLEDLSAGFYNLVKLQERDYKVISDIGQCVLGNADLLNATIVKVNTYEVATVLSGQNLDTVKSDLVLGLGKLEGLMTDRETGLLAQLSAMAAELAANSTELERKIAAASMGRAGATGSHELGALEERLRVMAERTDVQLGLVGKSVESCEGRLNDVQMNATHAGHNMKEVQGKISELHSQVLVHTGVLNELSTKVVEMITKPQAQSDPWAAAAARDG